MEVSKYLNGGDLDTLGRELGLSHAVTITPTNMKFCMHAYFIPGMCTIWLYFH